MKQLRTALLIFLALVIGLLVWKFLLPVFKSPDSFLKITTPGTKTKVYLDGELIGTTPISERKLRSGEYKLRLETELPSLTKRMVSFSTPITLTSLALTAVNYNFGPNDTFSSGDIRTFRTGEGLSILTTPSGADVWLDGEIIGKSPLSLNPNQGVHKVKITQAGYYGRELEINIESGFRLLVEVFLAANPFNEPKKLEEGKLELYDLSTSQEFLVKNPPIWSEGVFFFEKNVDFEFDALINPTGRFYFKDQGSWDKKIKGAKQVTVGYLGDKKAESLTAEAKAAIEDIKKRLKVAGPTANKNQVQILTTPTGTLNVRSGPNLNNNIITKVKPGEKYQLLDEQTDWYKIKLPTGSSGWISSQYAKRL